jgi:TRAP-type C4-dicarboxylate transport system permease small subunit
VWDYVHFMAREGTPVLGVSFQWVFMPFVVLLVALVLRCARNVWRAWQGLDLEDAGLPVS